MRISAQIESSRGEHDVTLSTDEQTHSIQIPPKATGFGSSANGGELLLLALATCYCNDIYREAGKRGIGVERVEVRVSGEFGAEGEPGRNVTYEAKVWARAGGGDRRADAAHGPRGGSAEHAAGRYGGEARSGRSGGRLAPVG